MNILLLCTILCFTSAAALSQSDHEEILQKGYTFLGEGSDAERRDLRISYYISNNTLDQHEALMECRTLGGDLLFILTQEQDEDIRLKTSTIEDHIWTSGRYDSATGEWNWSSVNRPFIYSNFLDSPQGHPKNSNPGSDQGVTIAGELSQYGWCVNTVSRTYNDYRFICQLN